MKAETKIVVIASVCILAMTIGYLYYLKRSDERQEKALEEARLQTALIAGYSTTGGVDPS